MKVRKAAIVSLMAALLLAAAMYAPATVAEENTAGTVLKYKFTEGETRQYRYTMTIADGDSLNAELVVDLTAMVGSVGVDGTAKVDVKSSLVSFKASTKEQTVEMVSGQGPGAPGTPGAYATRLLKDVFFPKAGLQVDSSGRIARLEMRWAGLWSEAMSKYPDVFCPLYAILVPRKPAPGMLPFWVHYPGHPVSVGESWDVSYEPARWAEGLDFTWMLKEVNGPWATVEQAPLPFQLQFYLTFGENWTEMMTVPAGVDFPAGPMRVGPVVREEKYNTGATLTVDLATGWIVRYQSITRASGQMTVKKEDPPQAKVPIDSTVTTVVELLQP